RPAPRPAPAAALRLGRRAGGGLTALRRRRTDPSTSGIAARAGGTLVPAQSRGGEFDRGGVPTVGAGGGGRLDRLPPRGRRTRGGRAPANGRQGRGKPGAAAVVCSELEPGAAGVGE